MQYSDVPTSVCVTLLIVLLNGCDLMGIKMPVRGGDVRDEGMVSTQGREGASKQHAAPVIAALTREQSQMMQLMGYSRVMQSYPRARLKDEFKRVATDLADNPSTINKIRMAVLLSIPDTSFRNDERAMQLLSNIVNMDNMGSARKDTLPGPLKDPLQAPLQEYAHVLLDNLQQRADDALAQKHLSDELKAERQKRAQLQKQLDALRSIEKSISQRQLKNEAEKQ